MADLTRAEKLKLEKIFNMESGYVLDFSNRTFANFLFETLDIDVYTEKYLDKGESKANRLRTVWEKESNNNVGKLILQMLEYLREQNLNSYTKISPEKEALIQECNKVAQRLLKNLIVEEIEIIRDDTKDPNFDRLAKNIRASIEKNEPENALDRLHTYLFKYVRRLCEKRKILHSKEESLNAIFGKYVKFIVAHEKIESQMTERILKYSISIIEAFNDIRNNKSFAHDNPLLNYEESLLIFNNITNTIRFIENIEKHIEPKDVEKKPVSTWENQLP